MAQRESQAVPEGRQPEHAPLPPLNIDAEESILGAMLLSRGAIEAVQPLLQPRDFYRETHGRIYRTAIDLHAGGTPVDAITLSDELERRGQLEQVGGKERIHELAALVPATSNAAHYARIVVEMAGYRHQLLVSHQIGELAWDRDPEATQKARELVQSLDDRNLESRRINWLTHQAVLELEITADRYLVDDLVPAGAVGTIAGVPETHKSWLAQAIAIRVARGQGWILGKEVTHQGPVGYLWQDDSTAEEAQRVKAFEEVHANPADLPILWGLNLGIELPRDIPLLRTTVEQNHLELLVLDSYYNFLPGVDLKDEAAEQVVALLKRDIADATGCTVLIVDHMPWATEQNRSRLRAYGGVFKNAATRFGIYIDAVGDKLHIEARGNNIRGINKRLAYWDPNDLELKLVNDEDVDRDDLVTVRAERALEWLQEHPGKHSGAAIREAIGGKHSLTDEALLQLKADGTAQDLGQNDGPWSGKRGSARYWIASIHAPQRDSSTSPQLFGAEVGRGSEEEETPPNLHLAPAENATVEQTQQTSQTTSPHERAEVTPTSNPGTQDEPRPVTTEGTPLRGSLDSGRGSGAPDEQPRPSTAAEVPLKDQAEAWIRDEGWMHPTPLDALVERFPLLHANEYTRLAKLATEIQEPPREPSDPPTH